MKIGFIGFGRMGKNMVLNLLDKGNEIVGYNRDVNKLNDFKKNKKFTIVVNFEELVNNLPSKKIIFLMITAGKPVDEVLIKLFPLLNKGDIIIDGGNSFYKDTLRRQKELSEKGIYFLDVGISGGVEGARHGACILIGGDKKAFNQVERVFADLSTKEGYAYVGSNGSGHFAKMVHNGIEYGMMGAIAEGMDVLKKYEKNFNLNLKKIAKVYSNGSIIESKLVRWMEKGMNRPYFNEVKGSVPKGETEDEMKTLEKMSKMNILKESIKMRENTRRKPSFAGKIISVMRNEFGGHSLNK